MMTAQPGDNRENAVLAGTKYMDSAKSGKACSYPQSPGRENNGSDLPDGGQNDAGQYADIEKLLLTLEKTGKKYDIEKIKRAYLFARKMHEGQFRYSGEAYISHPVAVAEIVAGLELDTDSLCAALLHDICEDCNVDITVIKSKFGPDVAALVDGLTKLVQIPFADKEEEHIENLRKMFLAMSKDVRVIFIKLCDRLHNMRTLGAKKDEKRRQTALETMHVYAPLAHRLGMQRMKQELENLALGYLDPIGYEEVKTDIELKYGRSRDFIERARSQISDKLSELSVSFSLEGRVKSVYSIYRKMYEQNKSFNEIYDFYALRVIVNVEPECYAVLGIIHDMFKMIPGRFKDYISTPKPNMYRSLHTTVIGRNSIPFEVQIRTWQMHRIAEYGVAAHWKYKSGESESREEVDLKLNWIAKLIDDEDNTRDSDEFLRALKIDILHDETFVFTPKGDIITLPQGATVIDFAYNIHSEVGNKMVGAKINGMIVPIDRIPQNGEIVEILTSASSKGPSRDWLKIVRTGEARTKIRQWFKKEKRTENIAVGKIEIDREFKRFGRSYTEAQKIEVLTNIIHRIGIQEIEDLYNAIGYGGMTVAKLVTRLRDEFDRVVKPEETPPVTEADLVRAIAAQKPKKSGTGVIIDEVDGLTFKFAKCCNPLPGDNLIGFITKGFGVSIHKRDCINVTENIGKPELATRWVSARWDQSAGDANVFEAAVTLNAQPDIRLLADITMALADMKVSLTGIETHTEGGRIVVDLTVACKNLDHLKSILSRLKNVPHVESVSRKGVS